MNMSNKDLNLLRIFQMLWLTRNVSKAAEKLGLSQPALSNALNRLRIDFSDPLFVRASKGMIPTPMAEKIYQRVEEILRQLNDLYESEDKFIPMKSERIITIRATDYVQELVIPKLLKALELEAPGIKLIAKSVEGKLPKIDMEEGTCDLALAGYFRELPEGFYQQALIKNGFKCVVRRKHPIISKKLSLKNYLELKHILINQSGDLFGIVDQELAKLKKKRRVVSGLSSFMAPGHVIQNTDYILTAPEKLCDHYREVYGLEILNPPLLLPPIEVVQVWHQRVHQDAAIKWFRSKLFDVCKKL